jgi:MFS family permease
VADSQRQDRRVIVLLCLTVWSSTFTSGAFPPLLRELDQTVGFSNLQLGALAGAHGLARMAIDIPVGLVAGRRPRWALRLAPLLLTCSILAIGSGGAFSVLLAGRVLMGLAHGLGMVAWLSAILRHVPPAKLGASLNAFELSAMIGMLGGVSVMGSLPAGLPWNVAFLIASAPQIVALVLAPRLVAALTPSDAQVQAGGGARVDPSPVAIAPPTVRATRMPPVVPLAFAAGAAVALTYATAELFMIPLRAGREFGFDRAGVARILMLAQLVDISALLPVGMLADRAGAARVLGAVMLSMAAASSLVAFGALPAIAVGAMMYGLGMAGWMLPLAVLRRHTPPDGVLWRTALYRVGVDAGMFLGPFVAGLLGGHARLLSLTLTATCGALGVIFVAHRR